MELRKRCLPIVQAGPLEGTCGRSTLTAAAIFTQIFCLEHRTYHAHSCPHAAARQTQTIVCPLCAKAIKLAPGDDANAAFAKHSSEVHDALTVALCRLATLRAVSSKLSRHGLAHAGLRPAELCAGAREAQVPLHRLPRAADQHQCLSLQGLWHNRLPQAPLSCRP